MKNRHLVILFLTAMVVMLTGLNTGLNTKATDDNPDFIIAFTGDLQGYLEECG